MSSLLIGLVFLIGLQTQASTLLVPDSTVTAEKYFEKCHQEGYFCTTTYFLKSLQEKSTPQFDELVNSLDFSSKSYLEKLPRLIQNQIQSEMISLEQLEMHIRLMDQAQLPNKNLLSELKWFQTALEQEPIADVFQNNFVVVFKKPVSLKSFQALKKSYLKFPSQEIAYNQMPVTGSPLVQGQCENSTVPKEIELTSWKIFSDKSCGWKQTAAVTSNKTWTAVKENKGWLLTGALLIGAAVLASQYEVSFQF